MVVGVCGDDGSDKKGGQHSALGYFLMGGDGEDTSTQDLAVLCPLHGTNHMPWPGFERQRRPENPF